MKQAHPVRILSTPKLLSPGHYDLHWHCPGCGREIRQSVLHEQDLRSARRAIQARPRCSQCDSPDFLEGARP